MNASIPLGQKIALVTGASGGIGSAIAKRLARDGASVLVHYGSGREQAEAAGRAIREAGGEAETVGADRRLWSRDLTGRSADASAGRKKSPTPWRSWPARERVSSTARA